ncbi:MAG: lipocalin family protein [candidate division WOR-3 bacterium]
MLVTLLMAAGFIFPQDHAPHEDVLKEWWYFSGILADSQGNSYSYCFINFHFPASQTEVHVFSMVNLGTGETVFRKTRAFPMLVPESPSLTLDIKTEEGYLKAIGEDAFSFGLMDTGFSISLDVRALKPPASHGNEGSVFLIGEEPSWYYSYTRMASSGRMIVGAETLFLRGDAWMDHQWGESETGGRYAWFSFRFEDTTEMMLWQFRDEDRSFGTYIDRNGEVSRIKKFKAEPLGDYWIAGDSTGRCPLSWHISVPDPDIDLTTEAIVRDQFFRMIRGPLIWEGACRITKGNKRGYCFLEMVGY